MLRILRVELSSGHLNGVIPTQWGTESHPADPHAASCQIAIHAPFAGHVNRSYFLPKVEEQEAAWGWRE